MSHGPRPVWATGTAIRSRGSTLVHKETGWSAHFGYRTACGRTLKDPDYEFVADFTDWEEVYQAFGPGLTACETCLKREAKK